MNLNRENKIKCNKNAFYYDIANYRSKYEDQINQINIYLKEYGYSENEIKNPASIYAMNVIELSDYLSDHGIEYFASEFGLRTLYEMKLISYADASIYGIEKLITKLNKVNKLVLTESGNIYRNFLINTGLVKLYVSKEVNAIEAILSKLENYKLKGNIEELMTTKYTKDEYVLGMRNIALSFASDCNTLRKAGFDEELTECEPKLKGIIFNEITKQKTISK